MKQFARDKQNLLQNGYCTGVYLRRKKNLSNDVLTWGIQEANRKCKQWEF